jgi:hypothetical protein
MLMYQLAKVKHLCGKSGLNMSRGMVWNYV